MAYWLGVDIGTTFTAAATWQDGRADVSTLGTRSAMVPSVIGIHEGGIVVGEAANRRPLIEPDTVAREFKRRVGDPTPMVLGGVPYPPDALMALLLRWVVDEVTSREGGPPDGIALSFPANWGGFKRELLQQIIQRADLDAVVTITEPEAAAVHYASQERVEEGARVLVYDLGGGTFDAAMLRKTAGGWVIEGTPDGIEHLGGIDFDEAVFQHVTRAIEGQAGTVSADAPATIAALARLRQECVDAKEALSADTEVAIPVLLPGLQTGVRLTRTEFERMIRPPLAASVGAVHRVLHSADTGPDELDRVLLVGGSSRIPLVVQLVASALGRPVAVDAHPKYGVALGASTVAASALARPATPHQTAPAVTSPSSAEPSRPAASLGIPEPAIQEGKAHSRRWRLAAAVLIAGTVLALAVAAVVRDRDRDRASVASPAGAPSSTATATTPATDSTEPPRPQDTSSPTPTGTTLPPAQSTSEINYPPLWPFRSAEEVDSWRAGYKSNGTDPWHLDAEETALKFTNDYLNFADVFSIVDSDIGPAQAHVTVGYVSDDRLAPSANVHLVRYGTDASSPWEVVGTKDAEFTLDVPKYGAVVGTSITVGGQITNQGDGSIRVQVFQPSSDTPIGESCCVSAGGSPTPTRWTTTVAITGARDPALTIVASTGGIVQEVQDFAITGVRPG